LVAKIGSRGDRQS